MGDEEEGGKRGRGGGCVNLDSLPTQGLSASDVRRLGENGEAECGICLEAFTAGDVVQRLPCLHMFHKECSVLWLESLQTTGPSCPLCKHAV